ncbi:hypothetical protein D3C71_2163680 [compost metagenome]
MQGIGVMEHIYDFGSGFLAVIVNLIGKQFWQRCIRIVIMHGASADQFNVAITEASLRGL